MRHRKAVIGASVLLALGAGATAIAAPGGHGPLGFLGEDREAEQARDLARELDLPEDRVRGALERVHERRRREHRVEHARELAKRLDVSDEDAARALDAGRQAARRELGESSGRRGFRPRGAHAAFVRAVAEELDRSTAQVRRALREARRAKLDAKLDEAVREGRLTREQAQRMKKQMENGPPRFHGGPRGRHFGPPHGDGDAVMPGPPPGAGPGGAAMPPPPPGEGI